MKFAKTLLSVARAWVVVLGLCVAQSSTAQQASICEDLLAPAVGTPQPERARLNTPQRSSEPIASKAAFSDQATRSSRLSCNSQLLPTDSEQGSLQQPRASDYFSPQFYRAVVVALKNQKPSRDDVVRAIYLVRLQLDYTVADAALSGEWRQIAARNWCSRQLASVGREAFASQVPSDLPSLDQGLVALDEDAVRLAWRHAESMPTHTLAPGCNVAVEEFLK